MPDARLRLSRNFRLGEFAREDGRLPPERAVPALRKLCTHSLQPLRHRFGSTSVHSAWRSEHHNRQVGGASLSFHRYDLRDFAFAAADVSCATGTPEDWFDFLVACGTRGVGLYATHVHADLRRGPQVTWRA